MNESFVESLIEDAEIRNYEKLSCSWSSCGEYLAISVLNNEKEFILVFYDNEYRLIESQNSLPKDYFNTKFNNKLIAFEWHPNLSIVACVWQNEQVGFYRIKHDTKKWLFSDAIDDEINKTDDKSEESDSSIESIKKRFDKHKNSIDLKIIHMNWLNEGNSLYYVTNKGQIKFFDFNLTENQLKLITILEINDELTYCIEVYFDQHSNIYLSSKNGSIYSVKELNKRKANRIIRLNSSVLKMIYFKRKSKLILISEDFVLYQYNISNQNNVQQFVESSKVNLEVFNKSFDSIEKLIDKRKNKKNKLKNVLFKQDDIFFIKIDEFFGIIGICIVGERVIRLFQIDSGQNLAVIAIESTDYQWSGVSYLIYDENLQLLLAGTSNNQFLIWKRSVSSSTDLEYQDNLKDHFKDHLKDEELTSNQYGKQFEFIKLAQFLFDGTINCINVNKNEKIAVISNSSKICLIEKQLLNFVFLNGLAIVQVNAKELKLIWLNDVEQIEQNVNIGENIKEVFLNSSLDKLAIRTNKSTELTVIELKKNKKTYEIIKTIQVQTNKLILQDNHVWQLNLDFNKSRTLTNNQGLSINCYSLIDKQDEQQIYPIDLENSFKSNERIHLTVLDSNGHYLLIIIQSESLAQNYCYLVYELKEDEAILKCRPITILVDDQIVYAKINSNGSLISIIDTNQIYLVETGSDELKLIKLNLQGVDRIHFASNESRLLVIQKDTNLFIFICFIHHNEINYQLYDKKQVNNNSKLIGFQVPYIYVLNRDENLQIIKESLNEFDEISIDIVRLIIDFLTNKKDLNLMIKKINKINQKTEQNDNLWLNLARISVKCRNVEMGLYCMGKLKNVRVIRDVKNELRVKGVSNESKNNLALAVLAMNLNLFQESEELFKQSNHNLKLVQYYESRNDWSIALKTIEKLNEGSVFYDCAKYYENEMNHVENAIKYYEKAGMQISNFEVTRMLFDLNELDNLKHYCLNGCLMTKNKLTKDKKDEKLNNEDEFVRDYEDEKRRLNSLKQWWGQYCESIGDFQTSLKAYEEAEDYYNQVRLLCLIGNLDEAKKVINSNEKNSVAEKFDDKTVTVNNELNKNRSKLTEQQVKRQSKNSAILYLGKHLESIDPVESVHYYLNCGAINHAIKTCKANQFDEQLTKIIQNYGSKNEIIDLLKKLDENEENYENLFNLYMKIEMFDKCLEIGFKGRLWSQLRSLLTNYLDKISKANTDDQLDNRERFEKIEISSEIIEIALNHLKNNSQIIDIVINMLLIKGDHKNLIKDLILDYKIDINNELIDKIEKIFNETQDEQTGSKSLLQSLAESALIQGNYAMAAKLFNSINDRLNSIKALIRLGDVQKVINYANISRDKQIYKITANFLQTTEGNEKIIESFLKKAGVKRDKNNLDI